MMSGRDDKKTLVCTFSEITQQKKNYNSFYNDCIIIAGEKYSAVTEENGATYLLSETTERKITIPDNYFSFHAIGKSFIIANYHPPYKSAVPKNDTGMAALRTKRKVPNTP